MTLSPLDLGIAATYLAIIIGLGLYFGRKATTNLDHYFLGGRSLPWYLLGSVGMANWFDLTGTVLITSFLFMLGPRGLFIEFRGGAVLVLAFMLVFTGKWHRRSGCTTAAEWSVFRFGSGPEAEFFRMLGAVVGILSTVMTVGLMVRGVSLFLGAFLPWPPLYSTIGLLAVSTFTTASAGFYGVVATSVLQGFCLISCCIAVAGIAWVKLPAPEVFASMAQRVTGNGDWLSSLPAWDTPMPSGYEQYSALIMMMGFYLLRQVLGGLGTGAEARYFGARDDRECTLQSLQQGLMVMFRWPMMIGFAALGVLFVSERLPCGEPLQQAAAAVRRHHPAVADAHWHDVTSAIAAQPERQPRALIGELESALGHDWSEKLLLVGARGTLDPEQVLPAVLRSMIPVGLKGLIFVALVAAMMASKNGMVNSACAFFIKDIYQTRLRPTASHRELVWTSYATTIGIVLAALWVGVSTASINDLWGWLMMSLTAGLLAPGVLRLYWWRCTAAGCIVGTLAGAAAAIVQRLVDPTMSEAKQLVLALSCSFGGVIVGSLMTAPTPRPVLREFYRRTRPFGWWKPLRDELPEPHRAAIDEENRRDLIAVPFALVAQVGLFLLPMQLVIQSYHAFALTLVAFAFSVAGLTYWWWLPLQRAPRIFS